MAVAAPRPSLRPRSRIGFRTYSPDGRRVAFESSARAMRTDLAGRGRRLEPDPAHARARGLPGLAPLVAGRPADRLRLAQGEDGHWDVWTIDADGGAPRRLTDRSGRRERAELVARRPLRLLQLRPRGGLRSIWRVPAAGRSRGARHPRRRGILGEVGRRPRRSSSASAAPRGAAHGPAARRRPGAHARRVRTATRASRVRPAGLYYLGCGAGRSRRRRSACAIPATGRDRAPRTGSSGLRGTGFAVSPDGKTILYSER